MEKDRGTRLIAIVALLIGAISLTIGFSAYSNSLKIQPSLNVKPDASTFNVDFSYQEDELQTTPIAPYISGSATAENAIINNDLDPTISNLNVKFEEPGDFVVYKFYARNVGKYKGYLTNVTFKNADGGDAFKKCTPMEGTNYVEEACKDISVTITIGGKTDHGITEGGIPYTTSETSISGHTLAINEAEEIAVKIEYKNTSNTQQRADGDFKVAFGDIVLTYSSADSK